MIEAEGTFMTMRSGQRKYLSQPPSGAPRPIDRQHYPESEDDFDEWFPPGPYGEFVAFDDVAGRSRVATRVVATPAADPPPAPPAAAAAPPEQLPGPSGSHGA